MDLTTPVVLIKRIVSPSGNVYDIRSTPYLLGDIPERYRTEEYIRYNCTVTVVTPQYGDIVLEYKPLADNGITETKTFSPTPIILTYSDNDVVTPEDLPESVPANEVFVPAKKISVNEGTVEEIALIRYAKGRVGAKTAKKLVEEREKNGKFEDIADLNNRVKLAFGDTWFDYREAIYF